MATLDIEKAIFTKVSEKHNADVFLFNGAINWSNGDNLVLKIKSVTKKKENCVLVLTTFGGDADAAFRMIRYIRRNYKKLIVYVLGFCKSAGTLMVLGADHIIMSDFGELGPLDVQMTKDDELINTSGLSYLQSLLFIKKQTFEFFEEFFMRIKDNSGGTITTRTAGEISATLAVGLLAPISEQFDPLRLGEVQRAINIALQYGNRICMNTECLGALIGKYPNHSFVIDYEEAKELKIQNVRFIEEDEATFEAILRRKARLPLGENTPALIECLYNIDVTKTKSTKATKNKTTKQQKLPTPPTQNSKNGNKTNHRKRNPRNQTNGKPTISGSFV